MEFQPLPEIRSKTEPNRESSIVHIRLRTLHVLDLGSFRFFLLVVHLLAMRSPGKGDRNALCVCRKAMREHQHRCHACWGHGWLAAFNFASAS